MFEENVLYTDVVAQVKMVLEKDVMSTIFAAPGSIRFTPDNHIIKIETWRNGASGKNYTKGAKVQHDLVFFANYLVSMCPEVGATWDKVVEDETDDDNKPARPTPKAAKTAKPKAPKTKKAKSAAANKKAFAAASKAVKAAHAGASQDLVSAALSDAAQNVGNPASAPDMTAWAMRMVCRAQVYTDLTDRGVEMSADDWGTYWELADEQEPNYADFDETLAVLENTIWPEA